MNNLEDKILFLVSKETGHERYRTQVDKPIVNENETTEIVERLRTHLRHDENEQIEAEIYFEGPNKEKVEIIGLADVVKDDAVWELKFVSEVKHEHFLQCALYMVALELKKGWLWNTQNNQRYRITVPDVHEFMNAVVNCITKRVVKTYVRIEDN